MLGYKHKVHIPLHKYKEYLGKITEKDSITQSGTKFIFRCPICGDSSQNKFKKRGWLLTNADGHSTMGCLNCDHKDSFNNTLKKIFPELYKAWIIDVYFINGMNEEIVVEDIPKVSSYVNYSKFLPVTEKNVNIQYEMVRKKTVEFIKKRRIPIHIARDFLYCPEYDENKYVNRVIIPHYMRDGTYRYFEARDLTDKSFMKYKYPPGIPQQTYNLNHVDKTIPFFIFEGAIDSFFVDNSIACGGASKLKTLLSTIDKKYHKNIVIMFDGDRDGIRISYEYLKLGYNVFVWNKEMWELRDKEKNKIDMNQLVVAGYYDNVLDEKGQIPTDLIMKDVLKPTIQNLLEFELHYYELGVEVEEKKDDRSFQKGRWNPNNRANRKSWKR